LQGRVLTSEKIIFAKREVEIDFKCDWTRAASSEEVLRAVEIKNWLLVFPSNKVQVAENFFRVAKEAGERIGIRIAVPTIVELREDKVDAYYNEIKKNLNPSVIQNLKKKTLYSILKNFIMIIKNRFKLL
jgi:hypothetical protein